MDKIKISRDAAYCYFESPLGRSIESNIESQLTWYDKSVDFLNQQRVRNRLPPLDGRRYEYDRNKKRFPTGLLPIVLRYLDSADQPYSIKSKVKLFEPAPVPTPDWAWPHQHTLIDTFLNYTRCLVQAPTASGKSTSISMIIEKFPEHKVLVVAPSINLVKNLHKDIGEKLKERIGVIGDGKKEWGRVTVSTARSLYINALDEFKEEMAAVDVLIFDEAHNYANDTGIRISQACYNTAYRCGLSATVHREDGANLRLEGIIGPLAYVIPDTVMVDLDVIHRPKVVFIEIPDPKLKYLGVPKGQKPERHEVYDRAIVENEYRNTLAVDLMELFLKHNEAGGVGLFIINRIPHGEEIARLCEERGIEAPFLSGKDKGEHRTEVLDRFRSGDLRCLIASSILNEGEDVPLLELVINLAGGAGKKAMVQKTGRSLRKDKTGRKKRAIVIDFLDNEPHYLRSNSLKRIRNINERHPDCANITPLSTVEDLLRQTG